MYIYIYKHMYTCMYTHTQLLHKLPETSNNFKQSDHLLREICYLTVFSRERYYCCYQYGTKLLILMF